MKKSLLFSIALLCYLVPVNSYAQVVPFLKEVKKVQGSNSIPSYTYTGLNSGDLIIAALTYTGPSGSSYSDPSGWTGIREDRRSNSIYLRTFYQKATGSSLSISYTGTTNTNWSIVLFRLVGVDETQINLSSANNNSGSSGASGTNVTSSNPNASIKKNSLVLSIHAALNTTFTKNITTSNVTYIDTVSSTNQHSTLYSKYVVQTNADLKSVTATASASCAWAASQIFVVGQSPIITALSPTTIKTCDALSVSGYNFNSTYSRVEFKSTLGASGYVDTARDVRVVSNGDASYSITGTVPTGLNGTYYVEVFANNDSTTFATPITVQPGCSVGDYKNEGTTDLWSQSTTWKIYNQINGWASTLDLPTTSNNVIITSNIKVDLSNAAAKSLLINSGNSVTFNSGINASLNVAGGVTLEANGLLTMNDGRISMGGNFVNNGSFSAGTSTVTLTGTSSQSISGNAVTFKNLTLNGTGNKVPEMDITVLGTMTFTSGYLLPATGYQLILGKDAIVSGANKDSYVKGAVTKIGAVLGTSFTFPVGQSNGVYDPIIIGYNKNSSDVSFKVTQTNGTTGLISGQTKIGVLATVDLSSVTEYWDIHPTWNSYAAGSNPGVDITMHYHNSNAVENGPANLYVIHQSALGWELPANLALTGTSSIDGYTVRKIKISNVTNFSNYSYLGTDNVLPVLLGSFNTKLTPSHQVNISWNTNSEILNKGFHVQRQSDFAAGKYESIGFVASKAVGGNSVVSLTYNFVDMAPVNGQAYYRLAQEDLNGNMVYSEVRMIKLDGKSITMVFPNPSTGAVNISRTADGHKMNIQVIDQSGRLINQYNNISDASYRLTIAQPGVYNIKMIYPETGEQSIQRVVVQK